MISSSGGSKVLGLTMYSPRENQRPAAWDIS